MTAWALSVEDTGVLKMNDATDFRSNTNLATAGKTAARTEALIEDAKSGRIFLLGDCTNRLGTGVLVLPAQFVTPDAVNFMATFGGGIICLALTEERVRTLNIPPMVTRDDDVRDRPYASSIEARHGVTTGISAADRSETIRVAINAASMADDIVSPGHVFPCIARSGGVLAHAGYTEATVDIARLAGLDPSAVVCTVLTEDGSVANFEDLLAFAGLHGLNLGTVDDLVAYRHRTETLVERVSNEPFAGPGGDWRLMRYRDLVGGAETLVLVKGQVARAKALVRIHSLSILDDVLGRNGRSGKVERAQRLIAEKGTGVLMLRRAASAAAVADDASTDEARLYDYAIGGRILLDLGVSEVELLCHSDEAELTLCVPQLPVVGRRSI